MILLLNEYHPALSQAASTTLLLASGSWVTGISLGSFVGLFLGEHPRLTRLFSAVNFFITSIPILVILFWLHYPLQDILGISIDPFLTSLFTLSLLNTLFVAGVVAKMSGEIAMDYREAAFVHGLSYRRMLTEIDIPLVIRLSAPQVIGYQVVVLHMTLFASLISVNELFRTAQRINAVEYQPVEIYSLLVLFFAAISAPLLIFSAYLDRKQRGWALGT